ncbi:MAG: F0F1 ATP synthase subunit B [Cytophagales bacterium]|nr:MAG: F0F1 ATP synthase subunit B [Cytophagales bacterium]
MDLVTPHFGLLFWQTITFLVLIYVLTKFAWKPIASALKEREATIENALNAAENAKLELANLQASNEKLLKETRLERDKVLKDAHSAASQMIAEAKDKAIEEGARQIEQARLAIENDKKAAIVEMRNQAGAIALQIAEKLLKRELSSEVAQNQLVAEYLKEANLN